MKIACESCGTKYAIADEKVRGKVFKIRCKKCQNVIVVKGTEGGDDRTTPAPHEMSITPPPATDGFLAADVAAAVPAALPAASGATAVWHVAVGKDQKGPFTTAEVKDRARRGEINGDTFIWREGLGDWKPLSDVPDFADIVPGTDVAREQPMFAGGRGGTELFGRADDGPTGELRVGQGVVSSDMPAGLSGHDMFADAESHAAPEAEMTGARHDTSVLFSLSNLTSMAGSGGAAPAKAAPAASAKPSAAVRTEGSGLIDIRQMAAGIAAPSGGVADDVANLGAFSPQVAAPVLLPMAPSGLPKWMWPVVGVGVVLLLGMGALVVFVVTRKSEPAVVQVPVPAQVVAPGAVAPAAVPAPAGAQAGTPAAPAIAAPVAAPSPESSSASRPSRRLPSRSSSAKRDDPSPSTSAPAPAPTKTSPKKGGADDLDALLAGATGGRSTGGGNVGGGGEKAAPDPSENLPERLSNSDIRTGMSSVRPRVQACNAQYRVPGTVNLNITIARTGKIQSAVVTQKFAGTPTGSCVEKAVKGASFPKFSGPPMTIDYPFVMQ